MIMQRAAPTHVYIREDNFRHFPIYILLPNEKLFSFVYFLRERKLFPSESELLSVETRNAFVVLIKLTYQRVCAIGELLCRGIV